MHLNAIHPPPFPPALHCKYFISKVLYLRWGILPSASVCSAGTWTGSLFAEIIITNFLNAIKNKATISRATRENGSRKLINGEVCLCVWHCARRTNVRQRLLHVQRAYVYGAHRFELFFNAIKAAH